MYYYNGAGAGAGDFNNDGKIDLFFAANRSGNALYLNLGGMRFRDITAAAGIPQDSSWSTGVSIVDINNDGMLDIYVCRVGNYKVLRGKNSLLICKGIDSAGIPHYADEAAAYGLDFSGYSTQSAFLDYDGDGDLDMFLLNHSVNHEGNYAPRRIFENTFDSLAGHRLYRNDMIAGLDGSLQGRFTDVSRDCGINTSKIGYGLGVAVSDINLDGWPDIYVGNDFHENDYLYINQRNGKFEDEGPDRLMHTSQFSMGVDVADANNDAYPEIISMDMLPYDPYMLRRSLAEDDYAIFSQKIAYGYSCQYARNNLQYNRGNGKFTEIGQFAGVHATDWSWASLWMDFNNDGNKDLFVSNGIPKRMNDIDYVNFVSGEELQAKLRENSVRDKDLALLDRFPEIKIPNQFFLNQGGFRFTNMTDSIRDNPPTFSNGAVYADLDNDGDLDIVVNNINDPVLVYENNTNSAQKKSAYARIKLRGSARNTQAIGARVLLFSGNRTFTYEQQPVHGFLSSMLSPLLVGLENIRPDSVLLVWPDNRYQHLTLQAGQTLDVSYQPGLPMFDGGILRDRKHAGTSFIGMKDITDETGALIRHTENRFNEFDREPLVPYMVSTEGPALAVADINHDGLEDFFTGSSKTYHGSVFLQTASGRFTQIPQPDMQQDSMWESVDATWQDMNHDTHPDLVIASGGNEYYGRDVHLKPLLYLNDGKGNLKKKEDAFGDLFATQSRVLVINLDDDGHPDLFIAGRVEPWQNGKPARSFLLRNDGTGTFSDVTASIAPALVSPGMVTDAHVLDMSGDGKPDLLLSFAWGGIDLYVRTGKTFKRTPLVAQKGWWQFLLPVDLDKDGDLDLVAGNFGLNSRLKASVQKPVTMYVNDFDGNGKVEQLMTYYVRDTEIPFAGKIQLEKSLPILKKKYLYAADFAKADLSDLFGKDKLEQALNLKADCFENMVFINEGNHRFRALPLPDEAQYTTYRTAAVLDADGDGLPDILLGGNFNENTVEIGRMDGDFGTILLNRGTGKFQAALADGIDLRGEVRKISPITIGTRGAFILARNNDSLKIITLR
jgi:hypothetical protein